MTAQQNQFESIVGPFIDADADAAAGVDVGKRSVLAHCQQRRLATGDGFGAQTPENVAVGGGVEPPSWVCRDSVNWPAGPGFGKRLAQRIFGQVKTAGARDQKRQESPPSQRGGPAQ